MPRRQTIPEEAKKVIFQAAEPAPVGLDAAFPQVRRGGIWLRETRLKEGNSISGTGGEVKLFADLIARREVEDDGG